MPSIKPDKPLTGIRYCSGCDRAILAVMIEQARFDYGCPTCGTSLCRFYSKGSQTHKERDERFRHFAAIAFDGHKGSTTYLSHHPPVYEEDKTCPASKTKAQ